MLEFDPQQRIVWYNLGEAYRSIRQFDKAIEAYEKSIEISKQWGIEGGWVKSYQHLAAAFH